MTYQPPSGLATSLDLNSVKFFPLNSDGTIAAPGYPTPATTPYEGIELPKPKTAQPNLGAPRTIAVVAQGQVQTTFLLPPIDPKSIEIHTAYLSLDTFAQLSRVKVRTIGGARIMGAGTDKQGFELPGMMLIQQLVAHDGDDNDSFVGYLLPRVKSSVTWPAFNENPMDVTITSSVGRSKKHALIGAALTEADDGALASSMFPFHSFGLRNIVAWKADGIETTFTLPADKQASATFADTFVVYDTTLGTLVAGTAAADQFVADSPPAANDILLGWYEVALS